MEQKIDHDNYETRADHKSEQARSNLTHMISGNAESVLGVLAMYIQAQGECLQVGKRRS